MSDTVWTQKGATFSDKSARKEFGLTQEEIIEAINNDKLQYRTNYMHGNPYFRLLRYEVEALVNEKHGQNYLEQKKLETELTQVSKDLKKLKIQMTALEKRRAELLINLGRGDKI